MPVPTARLLLVPEIGASREEEVRLKLLRWRSNGKQMTFLLIQLKKINY